MLTEPLELWSGAGDVTLARIPDGPGGRGPETTVGAGAAAVFLSGFAQSVQRFDPNEGALELISTIGSPPRATVAAAPAPNGGVHLVLNDGVVRTYDRTERSVGQVNTGLADPWLVVSDPTTGLIGVGGDGGAVVVDPVAGTFETVEEIGPVTSLGFARNGALLVLVESDGTVTLWDSVRSELVGTLWSGDGTVPSSLPWYDATTDSVWVATSGTILQFSLDPERWADRLCTLVGRELTPQEWDRYVPGDAPHRDVCD
jgi:WD40 repeat protein